VRKLVLHLWFEQLARERAGFGGRQWPDVQNCCGSTRDRMRQAEMRGQSTTTTTTTTTPYQDLQIFISDQEEEKEEQVQEITIQ
jgi:hypothetical protein